jgi:hypothetical protein
MILKLPLIVLLASLVNLRAEDAAWKSKPVPEWTAADAEQVLTDSPWTRTVTPTVERQSQDRQPGSGGGRRGGIGIGGVGFPSRMVNSDTKSFAEQLKKAATLKRDGKKDLKPSRVEVLQREDGPVILYQFPRTKEITQPDRRVEFAAHIGRLQFAQSFYLEDMVYLGQLEL